MHIDRPAGLRIMPIEKLKLVSCAYTIQLAVTCTGLPLGSRLTELRSPASKPSRNKTYPGEASVCVLRVSMCHCPSFTPTPCMTCTDLGADTQVCLCASHISAGRYGHMCRCQAAIWCWKVSAWASLSRNACRHCWDRDAEDIMQ